MRGAGRARPLHCTNAELQRYAATTSIFSKEPSLLDKLLRLLAQLLVLALWQPVQRGLGLLAAPLRTLLSVQLWMGRSVMAVVLHVERQVLKAVGWLAGRETSLGLCRASNHYFAADVKRWHVGLGALGPRGVPAFTKHAACSVACRGLTWRPLVALPPRPAHHAAALIVGGLVHSGVRRVSDLLDERKRQRRALCALQLLSSSYAEWRAWALQIEKLDAADAKARHQVRQRGRGRAGGGERRGAAAQRAASLDSSPGSLRGTARAPCSCWERMRQLHVVPPPRCPCCAPAARCEPRHAVTAPEHVQAGTHACARATRHARRPPCRTRTTSGCCCRRPRTSSACAARAWWRR